MSPTDQTLLEHAQEACIGVADLCSRAALSDDPWTQGDLLTCSTRMIRLIETALMGPDDSLAVPGYDRLGDDIFVRSETPR